MVWHHTIPLGSADAAHGETAKVFLISGHSEGQSIRLHDRPVNLR
jgi:hypothetical protein